MDLCHAELIIRHFRPFISPPSEIVHHQLCAQILDLHLCPSVGEVEALCMMQADFPLGSLWFGANQAELKKKSNKAII